MQCLHLPAALWSILVPNPTGSCCTNVFSILSRPLRGGSLKVVANKAAKVVPRKRRVAERRKAQASSRKLPPPEGGGRLLEKALAQFVWFLDSRGNLTDTMLAFALNIETVHHCIHDSTSRTNL